MVSAKQQQEVLGAYAEVLNKGALDEHEVITLHRTLKTLGGGAKYCELHTLEMAISEYEEILAKNAKNVRRTHQCMCSANIS